MGRVQYHAIGAASILALTVPAALLGLAVAAFLNVYAFDIAGALMAALRVDWQAFASTRWPELAGMVIGQVLLMAILLLGGAKALVKDSEAI